LAWVLDNAALLPRGGQIVVTLSGRGDKDMEIVRRHLPELCGLKN
jgi:tryptophan synthase beta chain